MPYRPSQVPPFESGSDAAKLAEWLDGEFGQIETAQYDDIIALETRPTFRIPDKPRRGMIVYADGTQWNPGFGEGAYSFNGTLWVPLFGQPALSANRTYYVRTDGSDSNDGLTDSAAGALRNIQTAINIAARLYLNGFTITIQVRTGTYTEAVAVTQPFVGGTVTLLGDATTPANVVISPASGNALSVSGGGVNITVSGVTLTTPAGHTVLCSDGAILNLGNVRFGTAPQVHIFAAANGHVNCFGTYTVVGAATQFHWFATSGGIIDANSLVISIPSPLTMGAWCFLELVGIARAIGNTYIPVAAGHNVTGTQAVVIANSVLHLGGAGFASLPGSTAGATGSGGILL